jgi:hypothetical protein
VWLHRADGEIEIAANLVDDVASHRATVRCESGNERVVTDDADQPRNPPRTFVDGVHGLAREHHHTVSTTHPNTAGDVFGGFFCVQRFKVAAQPHSLLKLSQRDLIESIRQLRLAGEDDR